MEGVGVFYGHFVNFPAIWYILSAFGIIVPIFFPVLVCCTNKIWQPWSSSGPKNRRETVRAIPNTEEFVKQTYIVHKLGVILIIPHITTYVCTGSVIPCSPETAAFRTITLAVVFKLPENP
jgi:hypothetical protein